MKIQKVIFAAIIYFYVQTANTSHDEDFIDPTDMEHYDQSSKSLKFTEDFIDPTDMEHYDQSTKSLKFTLKEKESHKMFKGLLQRLMKSAEKCGLDDVENLYDAEVILTRQAHIEISNFLKDRPCDPGVLEDHLSTILFNFKKHNEDEWKLKFKEFFQMDITKVQKLRIIEDMFTKHFQRILENAQRTGQADEINLYDAEVILTRQAHIEISNFLKDRPCDPDVVEDHLSTILFNFKKHNEDEWKLKFKEFFQMDITKVQKLRIIEDMLTKHFKRILENAQRTGQNAIMDGKIHLGDIEMEINKYLNNEDWDPDKLKIILDNVAFNKDEGVYFWIIVWTLVLVGATYYALTWTMKRFYWREPVQNEERNRAEEPEDNIRYKEEFFSLPTPETAGQYEVDRNFRSESQSEPDAEHDQTLVHWNKRYEKSNISNVAESSRLQTLRTTVQNDAIKSVRSKIQTETGALQKEENLYLDVALQKSHQIENKKNYKQECLSKQLNQIPCSSNVAEIKNVTSVETNKTLSHSPAIEKKQLGATPGVKESTDSPKELSSNDPEAASEEKRNVNTDIDTPHLQDTSLNVDDESDFIVINESAPESLTFIRGGECNESIEIQ
ncbi:uncharacterized protein LOC142657898 [Rhinoderma darwinii]|uniref:uncharacterized protein LOC142657898 n=1 Tax=Rhinoderma darwinii TaxID=43563 RepID=UPI003F670F55